MIATSSTRMASSIQKVLLLFLPILLFLLVNPLFFEPRMFFLAIVHAGFSESSRLPNFFLLATSYLCIVAVVVALASGCVAWRYFQFCHVAIATVSLLALLWVFLQVIVSFWLAAVVSFLTTSLPFVVSSVMLIRISMRIDRRAPPTGHCVNCGYDLAGLERRICPECGFDQQSISR